MPCRLPITEPTASVFCFLTAGNPTDRRSDPGRRSGTSGRRGQSRLAIRDLDKAVEKYFGEALASSTKRSYQAGQKRYLDFCDNFGLPPFPVNEPTLCYFAAYLGEEGLMATSIKCYLSSIRQLQLSLGMPEVSITAMPRLKQILKGVGVARGKEGRSTQRKRPITPTILRHILSLKCDKEFGGPTWEMFWGACCLAFFGFLRAGEVVPPSTQGYDPRYHLNFADLSANHKSHPTVIHVHIKASKTDPYRRGTTVVMGETKKDLCPVAALLGYLRTRGSGAGPLFKFKDGRILTKPTLVKWVQRALARLGYDEKGYSGHSFRVVAATTAASVGIQDSIIKAMGRWESTAYLLYIRIPAEDLQRVANQLLD